MKTKFRIKRKPKWFWIAAFVLLLWNLMGIMNFFHHLFISEDELLQLPKAHQDIILSMPTWINVTFGIAVFSGTLGSIALLLKRKIALLLFSISLLASITQLGRSILKKEFDFYGVPEIIIAVLIIGFLLFSIWLSIYARRRKWIR